MWDSISNVPLFSQECNWPIVRMLSLLWLFLSRELLTDRGTQFVSALVTQFCNRLHIDKLKTSPYHPQTNGSIERMDGTLSSMIRFYVNFVS